MSGQRLGDSEGRFTQFNDALSKAGGKPVRVIRMYKGADDITKWGDVESMLRAGATVLASTIRTDTGFYTSLNGRFSIYGRSHENSLIPIFRHEPENDPGYSAAQFQDGFAAFAAGARGNFEIGPCFMAYSFRKDGFIDAWWPEAPFDWSFVDGYFRKVPYPTWDTILEAWRAYSLAKGITKLGIAEWGVLRGGPQADGISAMGSYIRPHPRIRIATYWDQSADLDYLIDDVPDAMKAMAEVQRSLV